MNDDLDDLLGSSTAAAPINIRAKKMESRGPLHDVLTRGLPDLKHPQFGVCDLRRLAHELQMSVQGVYKWFKPGRPNRIASATADRLINLSKTQKKRGRDFEPLTHETLWKFIS